MGMLLKDLYNQKYINRLSTSLLIHYDKFKISSFINDIFDNKWIDKELKERMRHISTTMGVYLPDNYNRSIDILKKVFQDMDFNYYLENMIFQDFVEVYGLEKKINFSTSISALEFFTINSSSEFAIRQFILKYPIQSMEQMKKWAYSDNYHVRRLATEGCRPRLPWAISLPIFKQDPTKVLEIVEILKNDNNKYVQKSVANNLNDISKDNPDLVIALLKRYKKEKKDYDYILKHGCRTLLKNSNKEVLNIFGFSEPKNLILNNFKVSKNVQIGENLEFSFNLSSKNILGKLRIEFAIHFLRKNNKHNKKVFKISEGLYKTKDKKISKIYSFKTISSRVYYKGIQKLSIIINGTTFEEIKFFLI